MIKSTLNLVLWRQCFNWENWSVEIHWGIKSVIRGGFICIKPSIIISLAHMMDEVLQRCRSLEVSGIWYYNETTLKIIKKNLRLTFKKTEKTEPMVQKFKEQCSMKCGSICAFIYKLVPVLIGHVQSTLLLSFTKM